jgi:hypothetical protein
MVGTSNARNAHQDLLTDESIDLSFSNELFTLMKASDRNWPTLSPASAGSLALWSRKEFLSKAFGISLSDKECTCVTGLGWDIFFGFCARNVTCRGHVGTSHGEQDSFWVATARIPLRRDCRQTGEPCACLVYIFVRVVFMKVSCSEPLRLAHTERRKPLNRYRRPKNTIQAKPRQKKTTNLLVYAETKCPQDPCPSKTPKRPTLASPDRNMASDMVRVGCTPPDIL